MKTRLSARIFSPSPATYAEVTGDEEAFWTAVHDNGARPESGTTIPPARTSIRRRGPDARPTTPPRRHLPGRLTTCPARRRDAPTCREPCDGKTAKRSSSSRWGRRYAGLVRIADPAEFHPLSADIGPDLLLDGEELIKVLPRGLVGGSRNKMVVNFIASICTRSATTRSAMSGWGHARITVVVADIRICRRECGVNGVPLRCPGSASRRVRPNALCPAAGRLSAGASQQQPASWCDSPMCPSPG